MPRRLAWGGRGKDSSPEHVTAVFSELQSALGYSFRNDVLLREALTHKSLLHGEHAGDERDNERLEFLGDAVLALVVSEHVVSGLPDANEGELSKVKAFLVSRTSLAGVAQRLRLGTWLRLGRGEEATEGRKKHSLLANALEAVIAAVYMDGGYDAAKAVVLRLFRPELEQLGSEANWSRGDYKSHLQELSHKRFDANPEYRLVGESGPDHQKIFEMEVRIRNQVYGRGCGTTKKEAEQVAARSALEQGLTNDHSF